MLRKKQRSDILFGTYNRYSHDDGNNKVPSWFTEEEAQHSIALKPVTKEEVDQIECRQTCPCPSGSRPKRKVTQPVGNMHPVVLRAGTLENN